jgi:starch phosphorylase
MTTAKQLETALRDKLATQLECTAEEASEEEMLLSCALVLRDAMVQRAVETRRTSAKEEKRQVHYLSLEFLIGRSLMKNAYNLGVLPQLKEALESMGFRPADIFELEPDAALGNGGLGRLAACYLDSLTTLEIPANGYSICYEYGIFRQKIENGEQKELPDDWKALGGDWLLPHPEDTQEVTFGGTLREFWDNGRLHVVTENGECVRAVPCDMIVAGYDTKHTNRLRLWEAHSSQPANMALYAQGKYLQAAESETMAAVISKVLYPEDSHLEGKKLRLKQQYFFVSATVQSVVKEHLETYGTLENFHEKNVLQINDTHPTLAIPELMRVLIDDAGLDWDTAWNITKNSIAYTNHTVLAEALERWPQTLIQQLLPRVWQIITEIAARWEKECRDYWHDEEKVHRLAVVWDGEVRMANLCLAGTMSVNGVSGLHTDILRREVFAEGYTMHPEQFHNVTNGVDHRRWLSEINPKLDGLIRELTGDGYLMHPEKLIELDRFADDAGVLTRLDEIKRRNKEDFTEYLRKTQGISLDPNSIFDVQVKRLHEYKRQMLNALHILYLYEKLHEDPNFIQRPQTFLFGAKSAPGYEIAKRTISLINSIASEIDSDPICRGKLQVVFLENYRVSLAERLMPASEVSQQISTAGKEASGTGNMKFMMNGALTVGTLDGANVEMHQVLGNENMFLFGLHADEVAKLRGEGYDPAKVLAATPALASAMERLRTGFKDGKAYEDLYDHLLSGGNGCRPDEYMTLADFDAYCRAEEVMRRTYEDRTRWNTMSLHNIARSGIFAADRAVAEYADHIWHVPYKK